MRRAWGSRWSAPGALLVAWSEEQLGEFAGIVERARANGYEAMRELDAAELYRREPALGPGALGALEVPDEGLICPFTTPLAFATEAVLAGCELRRSTQRDRRRAAGRRRLSRRGRRRDVTARRLVNAAGLRSDEIDRMLGGGGFSVTPRRGELIVFDKLARPLVDHVVLAVPTKVTQGRARVADGVRQRDGRARPPRTSRTSPTPPPPRRGSTTSGARPPGSCPALLGFEVTAVYVGLRAATEHVGLPDPLRGRLRVRGRDPLHRADGVAGDRRARACGLGHGERAVRDGLEEPRMPQLGEAFPRPYADAERIAADPDYGRIVCFCERVTRGEIRDAFASPIPPVDLDGLRRRTRAHMGRCQGFFCGAALAPRCWRAAMADGPLVVVGGGPAGLAAAVELRRRGLGEVVVIEREGEPGGIPRHAQHQGFGLRDLRRVLSGPAYARRYAELARAARGGAADETMVTGWGPRRRRSSCRSPGRLGARRCAPPPWCWPRAAASARVRRGWCPGAGRRA